jgi:rod shape-determining protein MreD
VREFLHGALTLLGAVLIQSLAGPALGGSILGLNVFPIAVFLFAMVKGDLAGAIMGTAAGFVADAFSLGVFGINGLVYTAVGFLAGWVSRRINVISFIRSFIFIGVLAGLELALHSGLTAVVIAEPVPWNRGWLLLRPPAMAVAGSVAFAVFRRIRNAHAR